MNATIKRQYSKPDGNAGCTIVCDGMLTGIDVRRNRDVWSDAMEPATINWPGCGSVTVEQAEAFRDALTLAISEAKKLA